MNQMTIWIRSKFCILLCLLALAANRTGEEKLLILVCIVAACMVLAGIQQTRKPAILLEDAEWHTWAEQRLLPEDCMKYVKGQGRFLLVYGILGLFCGMLQFFWQKNVGVISVIVIGVLYYFWEIKFLQRKGTVKQGENGIED